jgi:hypothetical protein
VFVHDVILVTFCLSGRLCGFEPHCTLAKFSPRGPKVGHFVWGEDDAGSSPATETARDGCHATRPGRGTYSELA